MKLTPMKFDFTNFTARVAELNRLHKLVHELSDVRWRAGKAEDIVRWENAVKSWIKHICKFVKCGDTVTFTITRKGENTFRYQMEWPLPRE